MLKILNFLNLHSGLYLTSLGLAISDNYETVLPLLKGNDLSEKDKFVKALMLFRLGEYAKAKKLITSTQWKDPYHQSELDWVMYLMAYVSGDSLVNLESTLSNAYQVKAKKLLLQ